MFCLFWITFNHLCGKALVGYFWISTIIIPRYSPTTRLFASDIYNNPSHCTIWHVIKSALIRVQQKQIFWYKSSNTRHLHVVVCMVHAYLEMSRTCPNPVLRMGTCPKISVTEWDGWSFFWIFYSVMCPQLGL